MYKNGMFSIITTPFFLRTLNKDLGIYVALIIKGLPLKTFLDVCQEKSKSQYFSIIIDSLFYS